MSDMNVNVSITDPYSVAAAVRRSQLVPKMKYLNPNLYDRYNAICKIENRIAITCGSISILTILSWIIWHFDEVNDPIVWGAAALASLIAFFPIWGLGYLIYIAAFRKDKISDVLDEFEAFLLSRDDRVSANIEKFISEQDAYDRGQKIVAGDGAIVILGDVTGSTIFTKRQEDTSEVAEALKTIAGFIEIQKIPEALEPYKNLVGSIEQGDRPSKIRAFWNDLVSIAPGVTTLAGAVAAITKLFTL